MLGRHRLVPKDGHRGEVGPEVLNLKPSIRMVAGARFDDFLPAKSPGVCPLRVARH